MGIISQAPLIAELDPASLARLASLMASARIFVPYYTAAMRASVVHVVTESKRVASTSFKNPTGTLMRGITGHVVNPWLGVAGVGKEIPYARRREFGFTGKTDSLGRFYAYDPGAFYMHKGLEASRPFINAAYASATLAALKTIAL